MTVEFEIEILLSASSKKNVWLWAKRIMEFTTANKREMSGVKTQRVVTEARHTRFRYIGHLHIKICSTTRMLLCLFPSSRLSNISLNCRRIYSMLKSLYYIISIELNFTLIAVFSSVFFILYILHNDVDNLCFFHLLFFIVVHGNDTIIGNFIR